MNVSSERSEYSPTIRLAVRMPLLRDSLVQGGTAIVVRASPGGSPGDRLLGLEWVGDAADTKLLKSYDKRLDERIDAAAKSFESAREVSGNDNAASERGGAV
jgi:hypothetical protein